jgi:hypothetical protein
LAVRQKGVKTEDVEAEITGVDRLLAQAGQVRAQEMESKSVHLGGRLAGLPQTTNTPGTWVCCCTQEVV